MWHAKRPRRRKRKKRRRLPSACGKRSVNERGLPVSEGLAQVKAVGQETLQSGLAKEHGKRSGRTRAQVSEDPAQAKEDDQLTVRRCRSRSLRRGGSIRWGYCNQLGC